MAAAYATFTDPTAEFLAAMGDAAEDFLPLPPARPTVLEVLARSPGGPGPYIAPADDLPAELLTAADVLELYAAAVQWVPHTVQSGPRKGRQVYQNPATGELRDRPPGVANPNPAPPSGPNAVQRAAAKVAAHPLGKAAAPAVKAAVAAGKAGMAAVQHRLAEGKELLKVAAKVGGAVLDHMPGGQLIRKLGAGAVKVFHAVEPKLLAAMHASQELCRQACHERGYSDEYVDTLGKVLYAADMVGGYAGYPIGHAIGHAVGGAVGGIVGAKIGGVMPTVSVLYLIQSTARHPRATWRAAKRMVEARGKRAADAGAKAGQAMTSLQVLTYSRAERPELYAAADRGRAELLGRMADGLHAAPDKDWWQAVVLAAMGHGHTPHEAVSTANDLAHQRPANVYEEWGDGQ